MHPAAPNTGPAHGSESTSTFTRTRFESQSRPGCSSRPKGGGVDPIGATSRSRPQQGRPPLSTHQGVDSPTRPDRGSSCGFPRKTLNRTPSGRSSLTTVRVQGFRLIRLTRLTRRQLFPTPDLGRGLSLAFPSSSVPAVRMAPFESKTRGSVRRRPSPPLPPPLSPWAPPQVTHQVPPRLPPPVRRTLRRHLPFQRNAGEPTAGEAGRFSPGIDSSDRFDPAIRSDRREGHSTRRGDLPCSTRRGDLPCSTRRGDLPCSTRRS